ncbi:MAG: hypothetical protein ACTSRP_23775 [Candidatus Helarchaeota archaeon]
MRLYIFRRDDDFGRDFTRIPIDVIDFGHNFIILKQNGRRIKLTWDEEYPFKTLVADDIINIYILGNDFTKGYILPILRPLSIKDLDAVNIMSSYYDRLKDNISKIKEDNLKILIETVRHFSTKRIKDLQFLKEALKIIDTDEDKINEIRDFVFAGKENKSEKEIEN